MATKMTATIEPLFISTAQLAAAFNVAENIVLGWERDGLIQAVKLPAKKDSKKPPKRFFVEDVFALAQRFRGERTS